MLNRRQALLPLALAPVAGWAIWAAGAAEPPSHPTGPFHLPQDPTTAIWRDLAATPPGGPLGAGVFPVRVSALDGQGVTVRGFMVPLTGGSAHTDFVLAANPVNCPACQSPGPSGMIRVRSLTPLSVTLEPVTLTGTLRLRPHEGLYYRLDRAEQRWA